VDTPQHDLLLHQQSSSSIIVFSNVDCGVNIDNLKSTIDLCIYLGSNLISKSTHKQKIVSRSSTKVEYHLVAVVRIKLLWIKSLLQELHIPTSIARIFSDNFGVVLSSANYVMHYKFKHIKLDLHFVRDNIQTKQISLLHILARYQVVDPLTKPLSGFMFLTIRNSKLNPLQP